MLNKILSILYLSLFLFLSSCNDEIEYNDQIIGEGTGVVIGRVEFKPLISSPLGGSRASGNAIKEIKKLTVVIYNTDGSLNAIVPITADANNLVINPTGNAVMPSDVPSGTDQAEAKTACATFKLPGISYGKYRMYAVANMDVTKEMAKTADILKSQTVEWNVDELSENAQMFGYFTEVNTEEVNGNETSSGFEAPVITVNKSEVKFHAWIKRLASKVTIAFDPSGLHNGINLYIHKVTIKDIPKTCTLGENNTPSSKEDLITTTTDNPAQVLYYNNKGVTNENPGDGNANHEKWMMLRKISPTYGDHSENGQALYFYENMQGNHPNDPKFSKEQNPDEVGKMVNEGDYDYKDNISNGTYIEVEAYYDANVEESGYVSEGPIIYRFMLGKDIYYDYDAERNHHYKLTMKFQGYANQVDWHIVYEEVPPELFVPETFYVSYLYYQKTMLPIRAVGNLTDLKIDILENNWAPYSETLRDGAHVPEDVGTADSDPEDRFLWNYEAYQTYNGTNAPYLGFLSLSAPNNGTVKEIPTNIINDVTFNSGTTALEYLEDYYEGKGQGNTIPQNTRTYDVSTTGVKEANFNEYTVVKSPDGWVPQATIVHIPLITRAKSMISASGFSGNNPYDAFQRYAKLKVTATINGQELTRYVDVFQVRRIVNPKAVWRTWEANADDQFHVELMQLRTPGKDFDTFLSEGVWKAYVVDKDKKPHIKLSTTSANTSASNDTIFGDANTVIDFHINFTPLANNTSVECAIINVEYHGYNCMHKIFVREGYNNPLAVVDNGAQWCSFNMYSADATYNGSNSYGTNGINGARLGCVMEVNPLSIGSLFRRGNYGRALIVINNNTYGVMDPVGSNALRTPSGNYSWSNISSVSTRDGWEWARFRGTIDGVTRNYRVPTYDDFEELAKADYGFGVMYGEGANATLKRRFYSPTEPSAYGFQDDNHNTLSNASGVRGCIVYNNDNGNQVFFPMGRTGMARRVAWISTPVADRGYLRYADVAEPLYQSTNKNNIYRPIPYDLPSAAGAIYWINAVRANGHIEGSSMGPCAAWDMNYFSLDFGPYTANCLQNDNSGTDALPIKLVYVP